MHSASRHSLRLGSRVLPGSLVLWLGLCWLVGSGCKLLTVKMPGEPLSRKDAQIRSQTREFAGVLSATVQQVSDAVEGQVDDPVLKARCVMWKVGCVSGVRKATLRSTPVLALVDTWALCRQMNDFLTRGPGLELFGNHQASFLTNAHALEVRISGIARNSLATADWQQMNSFVEAYAREYPLQNLSLEREPVAARWEDFQGSAMVATPAGTTSEALVDFADRLQMIGQQVPEEIRWRLGLEAAEFERAMARGGVTLDRLDVTLGRIAQVAAESPATISNAVTELRIGFLPVFDRFEKQWGTTLETLQRERQILTENIAVERVAVLKAVDEQRAAILQAADQQRESIVKDAQRLSRDIIDQSLGYVHRTVRAVLVFLVILAVVILGLPFAFGYLVGKTMARRSGGERPQV